MAWSFTDLPYGWKIVTGITLAAATIFTADNIRQRINQRDEIELDLAAAERCYALQYGTNALGEPLFYVSPPEYVRSWYSNSYATQVVAGVTSIVAVLHTNIYTNAVGYRIDHAKAVARDATIKALCPFYVDTNSVYDGTTNIVMCTFTGLLTSLHLGDGTNFTSIPCWTNNEGQTNCTTNAATYGAWPWRIFKNNLEERYKVLNALKYTLATVSVSNEYRYGEGTTNGGGLDFSYGYDSTTMVATAMDNWEKGNASEIGGIRNLIRLVFVGAALRLPRQSAPAQAGRVQTIFSHVLRHYI